MPNTDPLHSYQLLNALADAGVPLPATTRSATLRFHIDEPVILVLEVIVTADLLHKIASLTCAHLVAQRLVAP